MKKPNDFLFLSLFLATGILSVLWSQSLFAAEPIKPIPETIQLDSSKVALGERLFHDPRLSQNGLVSCATCHMLSKGGTDQLRFSKGFNGRVGDRNSPTVFNSGFNFRQFWDGRARTLEEQVEGPLTHPKEMNSTWASIQKIVSIDADYRAMFKKSYAGRIDKDSISNAIATFERSLITPHSRFDQYLRGDKTSITAEEKKGYSLFKSYGCISCHQGMNIGGNMFQEFGVVEQYTENLKGKKFKVPSLRNIALTYPYFHDGSSPTLEDAVAKMARYQLGRTLSKKEIDLIVQFLKTLTGTYKGISLEESR